MTKLGSFLAPFLVAATALLFAPVHAQSLTMGGGFFGGTFNVFVVGIRDAIAVDLPDVTITATTSAGSIENLRRILAGEMDMAVAFAGDAYLAFNNLEAFDDDEEPASGIRALGYLYPATSQVVVRADGDIHDIADLAGKRIAVGDIGSGTHMSMQRFLGVAGILDDVTFVFVGGRDASEMLFAGQVDAYHALLGVPNATLLHSLAQGDVRILDTLGTALRAGFFDRYPFYSPVVIAAGSYQGIDEDVLTWKDSALWIVSADLDDDLVYAMMQSVYEGASPDHFRHTAAVAGDMGPDTALRGVLFPLHAGAARFWEDRGLELAAPARPIR
jgi:uncharacterized protein